MPLFKKSLVEQSRPPGTILGMILIQGKQENTCEGMQLKRKKKKVKNLANKFRIMENWYLPYCFEMFFLR